MSVYRNRHEKDETGTTKNFKHPKPAAYRGGKMIGRVSPQTQMIKGVELKVNPPLQTNATSPLTKRQRCKERKS